ncbi:MAG: AAA family ATPase [Nitrososphaerota archaeon]|nr:AAA family ATPase [Nitrososphaerota archaeon]
MGNGSGKRFEPVWKRYRLFRAVYHPLLFLSDESYRTYRFLKLPKEVRKQKMPPFDRRPDKENAFIPNVRAKDLVGRNKELQLLMYSFRYHVLQEESVMQAKLAPKKIIIIKGSTGSGKSRLTDVFMREAYEEGMVEGVKLRLDKIKASQVISMWMGQSTRAIGARLEAMQTVPSVVVIDEAQSFVTKGTTESASAGSQGGADREHMAMQSEILQQLDALAENHEARSIVILATDKFEHILEPIRRRAEMIDLDIGITKETLYELAKRYCDSYGVNLNPVDIINVLSQELRAYGKNVVTYNDVSKAFEYAVSDSERAYREGGASSPDPVDLDSFRRVSQRVFAYDEETKTESAKKAKVVTKPTETFDDIGGLHGVKEKIIQEVILVLKGDFARKVGYKAPRGFLFYGAPGTGKTMMAKAIANSSNASFFYTSASAIMNKWVGESQHTLRDIFSMARREPPAIIFMDEIDAIGMSRETTNGGQPGSGVQHEVLTELLTQLDGFESAQNRVVFIGSTNTPQLLDRALRERLSRSFEFTLPKTTAEKKDVLAIYMRGIKPIVAPDVTLDVVYGIFVRKTFSPRVIADTFALAERFRAAEMLAAAEMKSALEWKDQGKLTATRSTYEDALDRIDDLTQHAQFASTQEKYDMVSGGVEDSSKWPLTRYHLMKALEEVTTSDGYEQMRKMQRIYIDAKPRVGKAYGLAALGQGAQFGSILIVTVNLYKAVNGKGRVKVFGNAGKGAQESADLAVGFLREFIPQIAAYDINVHVISAGEGTEDVAISGPSGGQVMGVAIASEALKVIRGVELPVSNDITFTGKIEQKDGMAGYVGGVHPKDTTAKLDISIMEGFHRVSIPLGQYEDLKRDYPEYLEIARGQGTEIIGAKDLIDNLSYATGKPRREIEELLATQP